MGLISKLVFSGILIGAGFYVGHYMAPPDERFSEIEQQGIEMVVDKESGREYVHSDLGNVVKYMKKQDPTELEQALE